VTTACGSAGSAGSADSAGSGRPGAGGPDRLSVVVAFYPLQFLAEQVAGDRAEVSSLTEPGAEPHDVELAPRQVASIGEADLVVYERGFQPAVDEAVQQSGNPSAFDITTAVPLQHLGTPTKDGEPASGEQSLDPHVWLDPTLMVTIAGAVADRLSEVDPANAADYRRNAAAVSTDLEALDQQFRSGLADCQRTEFITQHAAFGYLARRYGLTQVPISGLSPDTEPSPGRIAAVQRQAREYGVTTIFYETLVSPAVAESIAGDLRLKTDVLDPIEGITAQSKGQDYLAVMEANLRSLRSANGCR